MNNLTLLTTAVACFLAHVSPVAYGAPQYEEIDRKYVTKWVLRHAILSDVRYCVPLGSDQLYAGKTYRWAVKPVLLITLRNKTPGPAFNAIHTEAVDVPPQYWAQENAVWWWDMQPADNCRRHDTQFSVPAGAQAIEYHTLNAQAKSRSSQYTLQLTFYFSYKGITLFSVTLPITIPGEKRFVDADVKDVVQVYKYCQCTSCTGTCYNMDCNGGCRVVYADAYCPRCDAADCCFSPRCPYYATDIPNDCECRYGWCPCEHHLRICVVHEDGCSYCAPQEAVAGLTKPRRGRILLADEPAWVQRVRALFDYVARMIAA